MFQCPFKSPWTLMLYFLYLDESLHVLFPPSLVLHRPLLAVLEAEQDLVPDNVLSGLEALGLTLTNISAKFIRKVKKIKYISRVSVGKDGYISFYRYMKEKYRIRGYLR